MKTLDVEQGSPEWHFARLGIPTASQFDRILTPKTRKPSGQADGYLAELVAEWLLQMPLEWGSSRPVERGTDLEDRARRWYEMTEDVDVQRPGFILREDGLVGASPDGLVGEDVVLEIKTPMALQHTKYFIGVESPAHVGQTQGTLYLTGRKRVDVVSFNPDLPPRLFRVDRDEEYITALDAALKPFLEKLEGFKKEFARFRVPRPWTPEGSADG